MVCSRSEAIAHAKNYTHYQTGMCAQFTRKCFEIGPGFGTARLTVLGAKKIHRVSRGSDIPPGVPVYWLGGYGHAAPSIDWGIVRSTDWPSRGRVGNVRIDDLTRRWGKSLVGWIDDINGVTIPGMPDSHNSRPDVKFVDVLHSINSATAMRHGKLLKLAVTQEVGKGKMNLASPILGRNFRVQYSLVQRKFLRKSDRQITNAATNGIPGRESLTWLGHRHGFDVV